jgi:hypothetical protein
MSAGHPPPPPSPATSTPGDNSYYPAWRVAWWDFTDAHDWIGRRASKRRGVHPPRRKAPPQRHAQDFLTREGAEAFVAKLRRQIPEGELVVQIISLRNLLPFPPKDQLLSGCSWPLQRRDD